ncbi:hypothetical protein DRH29_02935 [candidate division Kazan bacterium]|uniref:Uncharacterized protein n=1 Tax=candidate division Kazan bacterium TaxID=2202143 RepID=A0A420ZCH4_UNCK3|nr:MAG: hypothetical protein DRH29_02935 [candidate division Kazan bacterium]
MKTRNLGNLAILLLTVALIGCDKSQVENDKAMASNVVPVKITPVTLGDIDRRLDFVGTLEPWQKAALGSQIPGKVEKIFVEEGDRVDKGDVLVQMSDEQLVQAQANLASLEKDWQRMKCLLEKGTVTQQAFDQIDAAYTAAKAGYEMVLSSTRIDAPFSGIITAKYMEEGEIFSLMPGPAGSPAILEIMDLDNMKITIAVPEKDLPVFSPGLKVIISVDAYPGEEFHAEVNRIAPTVNPRTRMGGIELKMRNYRGKLKPGMFARVSVIIKARRGVLIVPTKCILEENGGTYVFLAESGKAQSKPVKIGLQNAKITEIIDGIELGDSIISTGQRVVKPGDSIRIVESTLIPGGAE